ncbi:hypothetical protein [Patulibacter defluvii]|uniref:hypothetical protein n=1 Tax=Patulibacter defluvii TaxID=3095358 RepID=UPI002A758A9A|nr:hypothetical protein [Patulibacter sp. DM4]
MSAVPLSPTPRPARPEPPLRPRRPGGGGRASRPVPAERERPIVRREPVAPRPAGSSRLRREASAESRDSWSLLLVAVAAVVALTLVAGLALAPATTATATVLLVAGAVALLLAALPFAAWALVWRRRGAPGRSLAGQALSGALAATAVAWLPLLLALALQTG